MTAKNEPTLDEKYPNSTEYKGRKITFSDVSNSDLLDSDLQDKIVVGAEKYSDKNLEPLHEEAALEVEKRFDKSQKHLRKLKIEIDDKEFEVVERQEGVFESGLLPYSSYESPVDLAQDVIDYISEFRK